MIVAILLLAPGLNTWLGEWTYGRWMMVHMNTALARVPASSVPCWPSLLRAYGAEHAQSAWCCPVLWAMVEAHSSSDRCPGSRGHSERQAVSRLVQGYARVFFPLAMLALWVVLAVAFFLQRIGQGIGQESTRSAHCQNRGPADPAHRALRNLYRIEPANLSGDKSRHRRSDRRKPARVVLGIVLILARAAVRHFAAHRRPPPDHRAVVVTAAGRRRTLRNAVARRRQPSPSRAMARAGQRRRMAANHARLLSRLHVESGNPPLAYFHVVVVGGLRSAAGRFSFPVCSTALKFTDALVGHSLVRRGRISQRVAHLPDGRASAANW